MRGYKRSWPMVFLPLVALLFSACGIIPQILGNYNINTTADTVDANPGDGQCADENGKCSLRAAIMEANARDTSAVINIPAGTYTLTRTSSVDEQGGDLDIWSNITLKGAGAAGTILDGNGTDRVLEIHEGSITEVEGVTIQNGQADGGGGILNTGSLTLKGSTVSGNSAGGGGGIFNNYSALVLINSTVSGNSADGGGGILNTGNLTLKGSTVSGNSVSYHGGGIYNEGILTLKGSTVSENSASNSCGGIVNTGNLTLKGSTVSGNSAYYGGGICNTYTQTLINSTVSGNSAYYGGGIYNDYHGTQTLINSTVSGNSASNSGGGIYNRDDFHSGTVTLKGVILANNTSPTGPDCKGSLTSQGYNLIRSNSDCAFTAQNTDIIGQDPALGPLGNNGGPTQTHLPAAGSPVVDKVPSGDCTDPDGNPLATDQRGVSRPQGAACDIGSVER